jgi:hypothetical protein
MGRHDEEISETTESEARVEPTHDEEVLERGDGHDGLEGGVDTRPASARENLRLT